jgi:hypothetical protein
MTPAKQRALVTILIGVGMVIVGIFGLRTVYAFREFRSHRPPPPFEAEPAETNVELIRNWMTIPFIGRMYHVKPSLIFEALGIPKNNKNEEKSLRQLNEDYFSDKPGFVLHLVKAALKASLAVPSAIPPPTAILPTTAVAPVSP